MKTPTDLSPHAVAYSFCPNTMAAYTPQSSAIHLSEDPRRSKGSSYHAIEERSACLELLMLNLHADCSHVLWMLGYGGLQHSNSRPVPMHALRLLLLHKHTKMHAGSCKALGNIWNSEAEVLPIARLWMPRRCTGFLTCGARHATYLANTPSLQLGSEARTSSVLEHRSL